MITLTCIAGMFFLVAVLPVCRRRENLWLFILWAILSIPVNYRLLTEVGELRLLLLGEMREGLSCSS